MLKKTVDVAGYATPIKSMWIMICNYFIGSKIAWIGPEIRNETTVFAMIAAKSNCLTILAVFYAASSSL